MTLTKAKIGEAVAEPIGYPKKQSFDAVETLLEVFKRSLESDEDAMIIGLHNEKGSNYAPLSTK